MMRYVRKQSYCRHLSKGVLLAESRSQLSKLIRLLEPVPIGGLHRLLALLVATGAGIVALASSNHLVRGFGPIAWDPGRSMRPQPAGTAAAER